MGAHATIGENHESCADSNEARNFEDAADDLQSEVRVFKGRCAYFFPNVP